MYNLVCPTCGKTVGVKTRDAEGWCNSDQHGLVSVKMVIQQ